MAMVGVSALVLSMFALSAQALPIVKNGSFEATIGYGTNTTNLSNPPAGVLISSANIPNGFLTPTVTD